MNNRAFEYVVDVRGNVSILVRVASPNEVDGHQIIDQVLTTGRQKFSLAFKELSRGASRPSRHPKLTVVRWVGSVPENQVVETNEYLVQAAEISRSSSITVDPEE